VSFRTPARPLLAALLLAAPSPARAQSGTLRAGPDPPPPGADVAAAQPQEAPAARSFVQEIPGTLVSFEMLPVAPGLWLARTETTWDAYDVFIYGLDRPAAAPQGGDAPAGAGAPGGEAHAAGAPDAVLRPTKPHMVTDRGWGHAGWPAMSVSAHAAQSFCAWLASATGRRYRLPTEEEWEAACRAGGGAWSCGDDPAGLAAIAWYRENAGRRTHPVASLAPGPTGLHDLHGNVAEWCRAPDGTFVARGGSYRDPSKDLRCDARLPPQDAWNRSDPNLPKSVWWLADAPFVGFRLACEGQPGADGAPRRTP
jgi:formylglycine-generating enzyme required for sulfatase activity